MVFGIFYYLINGIAWYCIVLYCVVGFGARAVSRKTPIYFIEKNNQIKRYIGMIMQQKYTKASAFNALYATLEVYVIPNSRWKFLNIQKYFENYTRRISKSCHL